MPSLVSTGGSMAPLGPVRTRLGLTLLLCGALHAPSDAGAFDCPAGTSAMHRRIPDAALRTEYCVDANGVKQGPARIVRESDGGTDTMLNYQSGKIHGRLLNFDQDNELVLESEYQDGREISVRATPKGMRTIVDMINADTHRQKKSWRLEIQDERTLRYTVTMAPPWSWIGVRDRDVSRLKTELISNNEFCSLFRLRGFVVETIDVSYVTRGGKPLTRVSIPRSGCTSG